METNIKLTEAEIKMIEAKRLEDEAAKIKAEAEAIKKVGDAVKSAENNLKYKVNEANALYQATIFFSNELKAISPEVTCEETTRTISETPYYYIGMEKTKLDSISEEVKEASIKYKGYKIHVERHVIYGGKWSSHAKSRDFEMQIGGGYGCTYYKKASTVIKKIDEKIEIENNKKLAEQKQKSAAENTFAKYKEKYPEAEIKLSKSWERSYGKKYGGHEIDILYIQFKNGVSFEFRIYSDGSISRKNMSLPKEITNEMLIDILSNVNIAK